ncbi:MAG: hypothetical protein H7Y12_12215 [Sphingobacteriaceae bacterium]|nr:hypothetical protein [Cytophagaceae bacterium]
MTAVRTNELTDGYELVFESKDGLAGQLAEFVQFERECCPWLALSLTFEPQNGPVRLRLGNSPETKDVVKTMFIAQVEPAK